VKQIARLVHFRRSAIFLLVLLLLHRLSHKICANHASLSQISDGKIVKY